MHISTRPAARNGRTQKRSGNRPRIRSARTMWSFLSFTLLPSPLSPGERGVELNDVAFSFQNVRKRLHLAGLVDAAERGLAFREQDAVAQQLVLVPDLDQRCPHERGSQGPQIRV